MSVCVLRRGVCCSPGDLWYVMCRWQPTSLWQQDSVLTTFLESPSPQSRHRLLLSQKKPYFERDQEGFLCLKPLDLASHECLEPESTWGEIPLSVLRM